MNFYNASKPKYSFFLLSILIVAAAASACTTEYFDVKENGNGCEGHDNDVVWCENDGDNIGTLYICKYKELSTVGSCGNVSCNAEGTACAEHKIGDKWCDNDKTGKGVLHRFDEKGKVVNEACQNGVSCNVTWTDCGDCNNNDENWCDNVNGTGMIYKCVSGTKTRLMSCGSVSCKNDHECEEHKNGDIWCVNNDNIGTVYTYNNGVITESSCENVSCNYAMTECSKHKDGSTWCEESNNIGLLYTSSNGVKSLLYTCGNISCNADKTACGECLNGYTECRNDEDTSIGMIYRCENGKFQTESCESNSCDKDGKTCGACLNDTIWCENDDKTNIGHFYLCDNGVKKLTDTSCESVSCDYTGLSCGECLNEVSFCEEDDNMIGTMTYCESGNWFTKRCESVSCNEDKCGSCLNGKQKCDNNNDNFGILSVCDGGVFRVLLNDEICKSDSGTVSCNETNDACGTCLNGAKKCENDENYIGNMKECTNGKFVFSNYCSDYASCNSTGDTCGECRNGLTHCSSEGATNDRSGYIQTCSAGVFSNKARCDNERNVDCLDTFSCSSCVLGDQICRNKDDGIGYVKTCGANLIYGNETACEGVSCNSLGNGCGVCKDGEMKCETDETTNIGYMKECSNGVFVIKNKCPNDNSCSTNECGVCQDGTTQCLNNKSDNSELIDEELSEHTGNLFVCRSGQWVDRNPCEYNDQVVSCKDGTSCGVCLNSSSQCINDDHFYGTEQKCVSGNWKEVQKCTNDGKNNYLSCNDNKCGSCLNNKMNCLDKDHFNICVNGVFGGDVYQCSSINNTEAKFSCEKSEIKGRPSVSACVTHSKSNSSFCITDTNSTSAVTLQAVTLQNELLNRSDTINKQTDSENKQTKDSISDEPKPNDLNPVPDDLNPVPDDLNSGRDDVISGSVSIDLSTIKKVKGISFVPSEICESNECSADGKQCLKKSSDCEDCNPDTTPTPCIDSGDCEPKFMCGRILKSNECIAFKCGSDNYCRVCTEDDIDCLRLDCTGNDCTLLFQCDKNNICKELQHYSPKE